MCSHLAEEANKLPQASFIRAQTLFIKAEPPKEVISYYIHLRVQHMNLGGQKHADHSINHPKWVNTDFREFD
jgi:hypothetical protein